MSFFKTPSCFFSLSIHLSVLLLVRAVVLADPVDEYVEMQRNVQHLPGVALAVTQGGKVIKLAGYGQANLEWKIPVTPQSVFQIQSVTKQFTATAVMMLVEQSRVSLDGKVSAYLDGTPASWKDITIRHLLTQTSGIKDFINEPTASLRLETTEEDVFRSLVPCPLNFTPGDKYAYSNSNYHLLAMIIRKVTGMAYGDYLREHIFEPLQMHQTRIMSWTDIIPQRVAGYLWDGRRLVNGQFIAESILAYGGGGILSTADDMAKWDLALRGEQLLKRASLEQMWSRTRLNNGTWSDYGFGWGIGGEPPHRFIQHSGGHATGFTSDILRFLDDDLSVIVLLNARHGNPAKMAQAIAALYVPALKPPERKPIEDKDPKVTELLLNVEQMIRARKIEPEPFTPDLFAVMKASLDESYQLVTAAGSLEGIDLLERSQEQGGARRFLYRMRFEHSNAEVTLVLDAQGKMTGLHAEPE